MQKADLKNTCQGARGPCYGRRAGDTLSLSQECKSFAISVTSRTRTPKEPATNRQKGAEFIVCQVRDP